MFYSIDYYSYTIPTEKPFTEGMFYDQQDNVIKHFTTSLDDIATQEYFRLNWTHENALRFYQHRLRHDATDITLAYGRTNPHVFVELAGKACNNFDAANLLLPLIQKTSDRCTRIDFAVDIECKTSPKEFIEQRDNRSFKSSGNKYSPTGGTEYIGGRTSERMARVYRYYEPHPRHKLLRVEAEYKGDAAKAAAEHLASHGLQQTCMDAHHVFGWKHPVWKPETSVSQKITYRAYKPADASTVRWLYGDVATAIRKACKNELIDFEEWLSFVRKGMNNDN